jgi:FkbM family methyltransferase
VNSLSDAVKPLCLALSDEDCIVNLNMAEVTAGHAPNSLGTASNQFGGFDPAFKQAVVAMRADNFARQFASFPDHIKLDVDGLEPQIISGAKETLGKVKSLLIEIEG